MEEKLNNLILQYIHESNELKKSQIAHEMYRIEYGDIPKKFSENFLDLIEKLECLSYISATEEINIDDGSNDAILTKSLIESIYLRCRALFLENVTCYKNYTLQNSSYKFRPAFHDNPIIKKALNIEDTSTKIHNVFNQKNFKREETGVAFSFFDLVRTVTNKYIAHLENVTSDDSLYYIDQMYNLLINPNTRCIFITYIYDAHSIYQDTIIKYAQRKQLDIIFKKMT